MEYSKKITHGSVVTYKGDKLILAGRRTKNPAGVFMVESKIKGFTLDGTKFEFDIPMGIRTWGEASVKIAEDK